MTSCMKWTNLKQNKCPKCGDDLMGQDGSDTIVCANISRSHPDARCDFRISEQRMTEIVSQQNSRSLQFRNVSEEENRNALNEL